MTLRNVLTESEIKVTAAEMAGKDVTLQTLEDNQTPDSQRVNRFYKYVFQNVLTDQPWNFSTKRATLTGAERTETNYPYSYEFNLPADMYVVWDIYLPGFGNVGDLYQAYSFPFSEGHIFGDGLAEVIGGKLASNNSQISVYYTSSEKISGEDFSPQFVNVVVEVLTMLLLRSKETDASNLGSISRLSRDVMRSAKSTAAIENRKAYNIPRPTILRNVDRRLGEFQYRRGGTNY